MEGDSTEDSSQGMDPNSCAAGMLNQENLVEIVSLLATIFPWLPPSLTRSAVKRTHRRRTSEVLDFHHQHLCHLQILFGKGTRS